MTSADQAQIQRIIQAVWIDPETKDEGFDEKMSWQELIHWQDDGLNAEQTKKFAAHVCARLLASGEFLSKSAVEKRIEALEKRIKEAEEYLKEEPDDQVRIDKECNQIVVKELLSLLSTSEK